MTNRSVNWKRVASLPRPRKGSILVLVVALLVLLALMGTAYLTTVRIDRAPITVPDQARRSVPARGSALMKRRWTRH